jgi:glucose/arabinose dehydrogenase
MRHRVCRFAPFSLLAVVAFIGACGAGPGEGTTAATTPSAGQPTGRAAAVRLQKVATFESPVYVTAPPGDRSRLFVVEQRGAIRMVRGGSTSLFLDLRALTTCGSGPANSCGEQGLLSMAFAPDYARSRLFYVYYTDRSGNERIVEYRAAAGGNSAIAGSARLVIFQADDEGNHNGGQLQFGPDKLLYIGLGDGGGAGDDHPPLGNGQKLGTLLGKLLRIDPRRSGSRRYTIPRSNPFIRRHGARREVYAYGLRNPWRFSFDRRTGDIAIGDVGQNRIEEIDFARRGRARGVNYGWRVFEGRSRFRSGESAPHAVFPVLQYTHDHGCSVTGGYIIRDPGLRSLAGRYVYGDYCAGKLFTVVLRPGRATGNRALGLSVRENSLTSFGEDAAGHVYVAEAPIDGSPGAVYRLVAG